MATRKLNLNSHNRKMEKCLDRLIENAGKKNRAAVLQTSHIFKKLCKSKWEQYCSNYNEDEDVSVCQSCKQKRNELVNDYFSLISCFNAECDFYLVVKS